MEEPRLLLNPDLTFESHWSELSKSLQSLDEMRFQVETDVFAVIYSPKKDFIAVIYTIEMTVL